jgi:hypothetical protein
MVMASVELKVRFVAMTFPTTSNLAPDVTLDVPMPTREFVPSMVMCVVPPSML